MFESSDRPQQVKQSSAMRRSKQEEHPQLNASADTSESSLISSSSSCSRNNSSLKPPAAPPVRSTNQTTSNPSTTSKTTDDTTSSSSSSPQAQDEDNRRSFLAIVQSQLAWQLAYYFAPANLAADTYLKTLQGLNDGCVPVNILANFGKIQTILNVTPCLRRVYAQDEAARAQVLVQAVTLNPDCGLQVVQVDANTGKVVNGQEDNDDDDKLKPEDATAKTAAATDSSIRHIRTIQAIRPVPCPASTATTTTPATTSDSSFTNCVLLRDVNPSVTEADIQDLLERLQPEDDGRTTRACPPVLRIQCDVANCWLISFDTTDRDTMLRVVMQLRTFTLKGDYVHARLKSSPSTATATPVRPTLPSVARAAAVTAAAIQLGIPLQKKKNRRRGKKKKKVRATGANSQASVTGGNANEQQDKHQLPPSLEDFPTLHDNTVEWAAPLVDGVVEGSGHHPEDDDDDEEEEPSSKSSNKAHSDAASTATTTSSSMESVPKKALAGYAAAVLKNSNNSPVLEVGTTATSSSNVPHLPENEVDPTQSRVDTPSPAPQVVIHPPSWGRGRSFADAAKSSS